MTAINKINPETIEDYIYLSCYRKAITIEQMCSDLNIPYDLFVTNISEVVGHKLLEKIMDYLNDDSLFLLNLPLTNNKNKPLEITPSHILSPDEFKHTLFESNSERYTQFSRSVNHYARQNNIKTKILSTMDLVNIVKSFTDIIAEPFDINGTIEYRLYKRGYDKPIYYMLTSENIQYYLDDIQYALGAENSSIWRKATAVTRNLTILASLNKFPQYNPAPSYYVLASNGIFNRKTKEFYPENSTEYTELTRKYHFIANASFNYLTEPKNLEIIESYEKVIEHISGGNGKSAFLKILKQLASGYSASFNMQDILNDTKLQLIQPNTKVIAGDELPTSTTIAKGMISRLKMLTTGDAILVDVKFKQATHVQCNGLKIQATNTAPKIVTYKQDMMLQHFINKKDSLAISCQQIINDKN